MNLLQSLNQTLNGKLHFTLMLYTSIMFLSNIWKSRLHDILIVNISSCGVVQRDIYKIEDDIIIFTKLFGKIVNSTNLTNVWDALKIKNFSLFESTEDINLFLPNRKQVNIGWGKKVEVNVILLLFDWIY